ncbi:Acylphosphate phosphohydrolase [Collimonas arenae]|uniref:Acylphosphatase n=1 Tax=Collimonas arenae TaxID=279058 RepID=A0A0A1FD79_9BURK|nr:acylphosphatase [Collimonas arenae]AIY41730.1 Acylphosphate phosphohydrolase [Collimonas arenae]
MIAKRLRVHGLVQGVGFRFSAMHEARQLGVNGWVRNRLDGSVEIQVEGGADAVNAMMRWAAHGPASARVVRLEVRDEKLEGCKDFSEHATY